MLSMETKKAKQKLDKVLSDNPDPSKWSKWIKLTIKVLVLILSAVFGDAVDFTDIITNLI